MRFLYLLILPIVCNSTVLNIPLTIQKHDQWCWAGASTAIINYFGSNIRQCDAANYARLRITQYPHPLLANFGTTDCCLDTTTFNMATGNGSCNNVNANWGNPGTMADILSHWGISNGALGGYYTETKINTEITAGRPFIIRYAWTAGGAHFIVGRGIVGSDIYLMNPWPGNGYEIATYNSVVSAPDHQWTHTTTILSTPSSGIFVSSSSTIPTSSVQQSSSSSPLNMVCNGISNWSETNSYPTQGTQVAYSGQIWSNKWYSNPGETPGINPVWEYKGNCTTLPSSSATIYSSSSMMISSSSLPQSSSLPYSSSLSKSQSITFEAPNDTYQSKGHLSLQASASSGLTVTFASLSTLVCDVSGNLASFLGPGICTIEAYQIGDQNYKAAPIVQQSFKILPDPPSSSSIPSSSSSVFSSSSADIISSSSDQTTMRNSQISTQEIQWTWTANGLRVQSNIPSQFELYTLTGSFVQKSSITGQKWNLNPEKQKLILRVKSTKGTQNILIQP